MKIGEIIPAERDITLNEGKKTVTILVANKGDRPVIASGTSVRFEPGEEKEVQLTEMGGRKRVFGLNDLTRAQTGEDTKATSMETAKLKGFL